MLTVPAHSPSSPGEGLIQPTKPTRVEEKELFCCSSKHCLQLCLCSDPKQTPLSQGEAGGVGTITRSL